MGATADQVAYHNTRCGFNPRPRMGATARRPAVGRGQDVSIRAPAWGRPSCACRGRSITSFNPRPRMGATRRRMYANVPFRVSIRAPAWGRRLNAVSTFIKTLVSIRAPAWGRLGFNPRPRMGATIAVTVTFSVSIRAPAWGRLRDRIHLLKNVKFANVREVVYKTFEIPGGRHSLLGNLAKNHRVTAIANPSSYS